MSINGITAALSVPSDEHFDEDRDRRREVHPDELF
jgi:hypothetical protein